jgi:hypothetical protein
MQQTTFLGKLTARPSIFLVLAGLLIVMAAAPMAAGATHKEGHVGNPNQALAESLSIDLENIDVTDVVDSELGAGTFDGVFNISSFDIEDGELVAVGNIVGEYTSDEGDVIPFDEAVAVPVSSGGGDEVGVQQENDTCDILFLELGPVFLDVLGLVVEIPDPIVLDIYAERGPGNLLGNLLCSIVGILDPAVEDPVGTPLDQLLNNVNRLLERILG